MVTVFYEDNEVCKWTDVIGVPYRVIKCGEEDNGQWEQLDHVDLVLRSFTITMMLLQGPWVVKMQMVIMQRCGIVFMQYEMLADDLGIR